MFTRRTNVLAGTAVALATIALAAHRWHTAEPTVVVIRDPAGQRATLLLNAADTAIAHGRPAVARAALASAYDQPTASPEIAMRVARLADRLDDPRIATLAYRRYLSAAPGSPAADTVRTRLVALVREQPQAPAARTTATSAGETEPVAREAVRRQAPRRPALRTAQTP